MARVDKPVLLRRLFELGCHYSSQILSYQKMLGQLSDVGNATTLAHYLILLKGAGMLTGIDKFSGAMVSQRASSPKLQVFNTALISAQRQIIFQNARTDTDYWGRLVESAVGAHLLNEGLQEELKLFYWRDRNQEIDFSKKYQVKRVLLVGGEGVSLEKFFTTPVRRWVE